MAPSVVSPPASRHLSSSSGINVKKRKASSSDKQQTRRTNPNSNEDSDVDVVGLDETPTKKSRKDTTTGSSRPTSLASAPSSAAGSVAESLRGITTTLRDKLNNNPDNATISIHSAVSAAPSNVVLGGVTIPNPPTTATNTTVISHRDSSTTRPSPTDPAGDTKSSSTATPKTKASAAGRSKPNTASSSSTSTTEVTPTTKRVLPPRRGMLRDKNAFPADAAALLGLGPEAPLTPAGEYVLYLANKRVQDRTVFDAKRVPPATYGGNVDEKPSQTRVQTTSTLRPPPSATTHIEVPIFKLCSIAQFVQEEKKRKMAALTKALAKAEADALAEARVARASKAMSPESEAGPQPETNQKVTGTSTSTRAVSTRQKHKEIVSHQQISVLASTGSHGKKATTTMTLGKKDGSRARSSVPHDEDLRDEVYEKRHKKQETAEKKIKNREKEKLRHAMYQQRLMVEKLRHIEINRLMPISTFRSLQKTVEMEQKQNQQQRSGMIGEDAPESSSTSLAAAKLMQDEYHRRLLREAEENLRRYEQLGLGESNQSNTAHNINNSYSPYSRTKERLTALSSLTLAAREEKQRMQDIEKRESVHRARKETGEGQHRKRTKTVTADGATEDGPDKPGLKIRLRISNGCSSSTPRSSLSPKPASSRSASRETSSPIKTLQRTPTPAPTPAPKPITTFIKPGSIMASGSRKSHRVALAFGEKVPLLEKMEFSLPMEDFGFLIRARNGEPEPEPVEALFDSTASRQRDIHARLEDHDESKDWITPKVENDYRPSGSSTHRANIYPNESLSMPSASESYPFSSPPTSPSSSASTISIPSPVRSR
ncbi:hypothetical protein BGZ83_001498 [Gryganskiella cystojenkinii]|nr:hypothetical protein BGZ83_001498 [Gryganskiella cystojenkinii]